jgi:hypothetical protein
MPSITLQTLETRTWDRLENNQLFYPKVSVDRAINEALKITNLFAGWSQGSVDAGVTVAGRVIYRTPPGILFPMKVYVDQKEIIKDSIDSLSNTVPKWIRGYGVKAKYWAPIGLNLFCVFPSDKLGGRDLSVWGVTEPPDLVSPTDVATLADEFVGLVVDYAFMVLVLREGGKIFTDAARGYKPWLQRMSELQRWENEINPAFRVEVKQAA